jgi:hypothetical protein
VVRETDTILVLNVAECGKRDRYHNCMESDNVARDTSAIIVCSMTEFGQRDGYHNRMECERMSGGR